MALKRITVTQNDIDLGLRKSFCDCPVARAVRRAFRVKPWRKVYVRHEGILVGEPDDERVWMSDMPDHIEKFIERFDKGKPVEPFTALIEFR